MSEQAEGKCFYPKSNEDVVESVQWALAEKSPLEIIGQGSKRALGVPHFPDHCLDMSSLSGVSLFEPEELVLSAKSGTPLSDIYALLEAHNQQLQFEPVDLGPVLGGIAGHGTWGGLVNTNICGPRRLQAGSVRDHILGIHGVSGRGEAFKSGGRVVKNVTGYDLSKGVCGSYGTLAVLCDITMKVMPKAETEQTLVLYGLSDEQATEAMAQAMGSHCEVSAAAHLPAEVASNRSLTLLRLEGFVPSVNYRIENLSKLLAAYGKHERLEAQLSISQWWAVRDCIAFADHQDKPLWRISCTPSKGAQIVKTIRDEISASAYYDWQGGLIWLQINGAEPQDKVVRRALHNHGGGHATLIRADKETRQTTAVFEPQAAPLAALSARYRKNFDPLSLLNPKRMGG